MQKRYGLRVYADKAFDKVNDQRIVPMLRSLRGADAMGAFASRSYIESYACFLELLAAVNNWKQIIFVFMEEGLYLGDSTDLLIVERDALSRYDSSDPFINFFRNASINRKTINDLRAVRGTSSSVGKRVFDRSLVAEQPEAVRRFSRR